MGFEEEGGMREGGVVMGMDSRGYFVGRGGAEEK